ncbi:NDP-sugar synthase [Calditrichota bacterium]
MKAIILAGGKGTRLKPYTMVLPKPLIPVYDVPIIEIIICKLIVSGISEIIVSCGYLHHLIQTYLDDGKRFGIPIRYVIEETPLGTAGSISLVKNLSDHFIVINGDTLCDIDFDEMLKNHPDNNNDVTIGTYRMKYQIDLGVLNFDSEMRLEGYVEKPTDEYLISMGVYIFSSKVLKSMNHAEKIDLPDFILKLLKNGYRIAGYEHKGIWLDMGRPSDFVKIQEDEELHNRLKPLLGKYE